MVAIQNAGLGFLMSYYSGLDEHVFSWPLLHVLRNAPDFLPAWSQLHCQFVPEQCLPLSVPNFRP
jgi:hypothetical protein